MINYGRIGTFDFRCRFDPFAEATPGRDLTINYDHGSNYTNDLEVGDDAASWDGTAKILFFTNENFDEEINQSGLTLGSRLHFSVTWMEEVDADFPVLFYVDQCTVSSLDEKRNFTIIKDGCLSEFVRTQSHQKPTSDIYSHSKVNYSYRSFTFAEVETAQIQQQFRFSCALTF